MRTALIVGSAGQDGTLLSEHLRARAYRVVGVTRGQPPALEDAAATAQLVADVAPDEIYYLAAFHHSSEDPPLEPLALFERSFAVHVVGLLHVLEAMRTRAPRAHLFYAGSALMFGDAADVPQTEATPFAPTCAYGITKTAGLHMCRFYRRTHGLHASVGFLYNHESPLRAAKFVSKKIVTAAWEIQRGTRDKLVLGDLSAELDMGYAPDFVDAMHRIAQLDQPDDFIVATGEKHAIREFVELAFERVGLGWRAHVEENRAVITRRPQLRLGDPSKLVRATGWRPSTTFADMVRVLVDTQAPR
jgi:GDPmannose 4,6-dehydratase